MGSIVDKISKEQFETAYNHHLPNAWIKFVFRYFSVNTEIKDLKVRKSLQYILLSLFVIGFVGTVVNAPKSIIGIATLTYTGILLLIGIIMSSGAILNNLRIRKIRKELGITKAEYETLVRIYYE